MTRYLAPAMAIGGLVTSSALALATTLVAAAGSAASILAAIVALFLVLGLWAYLRRSSGQYIIALGGQMVFSLIILGLSGGPALILWALMFAHLALILTGSRGLWLRAHLPVTEGPLNDRTARLLTWDLVTAGEWLGASAAISAAFFAATPWLVVNGSIALLTLLAVTALFSFTVLAARLGVSSAGKEGAEGRDR
jgi:hypothetical protein